MILGVLVVTLLWRLVIMGWSFNLGVLLWVLGGLLGFLFVFSDRMIYSLVSETEDMMSVRVRELFKGGKLIEGLEILLTERDEPKKLTMRSILFFGVWIVLGLWTMVGVLNPFARGLMLGIGTHLVFDLTWDYFDKNKDVRNWFWQIKRPFTAQEVKIIVWVMIAMALVIIRGL